jgi:PAS domain S-box-containing protein
MQYGKQCNAWIVMAVFRVLYVDDEPELLQVGRIFLEREGQFTVDTITSAPVALALLDSTSYDAIISDYQMPEMDGIELLKKVRKSGNHIPFILFTGRGREEVVIQALNEGADFYLQKGGDTIPQFTELSHKLRQAIQRRLAEGLLHENENKFRSIFENSPYPICINSVPEGKFIAVNAAFISSSGYTESEIMGKTPVELNLLGLTEIGRLTSSFVLKGRIENVPLVLTGKGGRKIHVQFSTIPITIGDRPAVMTMVAEITRIKRVEEELLQKNQVMTIINDLEREFAGLPSGRRVENLAAKKLSALSGAVVTVFSTYYPADQILRTTSIEFAPGILESLPGSWEKVSGLLGMQPDKVEIPVSKEIYHDINRSIIGTKKTIAEISYGKISSLVSATIQKLSGIDRFIHIAHIIDGELYGTSVIGMRPDRPDPSAELLDSFGHMVAVSLRRQRAEAALRENEEKYRDLVETANSIILKWDKTGKITFFNEFAQKFFGYTQDEIIGKPVMGTIVPARESGSDRDLSDMIDGIICHPEDYLFNENENITREGKRVWIRWQNKPLLNEKGEFTGLFSIGTDITDRKQAEEELRESDERLRQITENITTVFYIYDRASDRFVYVSPAFEKVWMRPCQSLIDDPYSYLAAVHPGDLPHLQESIRRDVEEDTYVDTDYRIIRPDGTVRWIHVRNFPVTNEQGSVYRVAGVAEDITDLKNSRLALQESEEKFRSLVEYARESVLLVDFDGKILFANNAAARTIEMDSLKGLVGRNVMEFIAPECREDVIKDFMQVAQGHDAYLAKYSALSAQGKKIRLECIGKLITYEGKPADIISIRDITESEKAVDALRESEEKYRTLANHLPEFIFIHCSGIIRYVNEAVTEITGRSSAELIGHSLMEFIAPESRAVVEENIRLRDQGNRHSTYEAAILVKDGEKHYGIVNSTLITYEGMPASLVVVSDITHRRFAEDALRRSNRQLSLLSSITRHDINNQLLTLNGFVSLLHGKIPDPAFEKFFSRITEASNQITAMIQFTREYEQIGAGTPVWQDLQALVNTAGKDVMFGDVVLNNDIPSGTEIFADPLIVKVFFNLMDNALRHGGRLTTIRFSSEARNEDRIILCEDDGNGVGNEEKERIFDRGFGRNTGYGLAISREILDITGMTIRETGEPGKDARFEITVPEGAFRVSGV